MNLNMIGICNPLCVSYNAEDKSDYEDGMTVNYELDEASIQNMDSFLELGT